MNAFLAKIVAWITAGYPEGVPGPDRVPLMALLNRRLSNDEVAATDELPRPEDVERVRERLAVGGWPLDDPREDGADLGNGGEGSA